MKDNNLQIKLVNQALAAAQASIDLAKSLLADFSGEAVKSVPRLPIKPAVLDAASVPGILGTYDGENMVTDKGEKFPVPPNYASKTLLVYGDKLKMIDGESEIPGGEKKKLFKSIERLTRQKVSGILSKKKDQWLLVTSDGSHKVLEASVNYYGYKEGDHLVGLLPAKNLQAPFAALEGKEKSVTGVKEATVVEAAKKTSETSEIEKPAKTKRAARKAKASTLVQ